jgi:hypothetical protein
VWELPSKTSYRRKDRGKDKVKGRRGRKYKQLLDDLKEKRWYLKFKEEYLDRTLWRTSLERGCGHVVGQTAKWMNITRLNSCFV